LRGEEELKQVEVTQIKDEIRYLSRSDKIEIYRWLDGELAGDLPYKDQAKHCDTKRGTAFFLRN